MKPTQSEQDEFLKEIRNDAPVLDDAGFDKLLNPSQAKQGEAAEPATSEGTEDDSEDTAPKNRRYRRLQDKFQKERESSIVMGETIKQQSERIKFLEELYAGKQSGEMPDALEERIFGKDENGKLVRQWLDSRLSKAKDEAKEEAIREIRSQEEASASRESEYSSMIDQRFEELEDKYNVDLSGSTKASKDFRNNFIDFLVEMSPKDSNGEIIEYADFTKSFEAFSKISSKEKPREVSDRQKELASRSMASPRAPSVEMPKGPMTFREAQKFLDSQRSY